MITWGDPAYHPRDYPRDHQKRPSVLVIFLVIFFRHLFFRYFHSISNHTSQTIIPWIIPELYPSKTGSMRSLGLSLSSLRRNGELSKCFFWDVEKKLDITPLLRASSLVLLLYIQLIVVILSSFCVGNCVGMKVKS